MKLLSLIVLSFAISLNACNSNTSNKEKQEPQTLSEQLEGLNIEVLEDPNQPEVYHQIARIHHELKDPNNAIINMQKAIENDRENISYYLYMADLYMELGQLKNTMITLQQASVVDSQNTAVILKTAEIYFMFKKYTETFEFVNKALEIEPNNEKAFYLRGHIYKELGDTNKAITNFMDAINNYPDHFNANLELGILFASQGNALAIDYYGNAMRIDSTRVEPYYNLGMFYQDNKLENEAIAIYKLLMDFAPEFEYAPYNIGYILLEVLKLPDEALPYFTKAIDANPNYVEAYFNRGLCYEGLGNVTAARLDYNTSLRLKTNYLRAIEALNRLDRGDKLTE